MDDVVEELLKIVVESLQSDEGNLNKAVDLAVNFSKENSISPDSLLELSSSYGSNKSYSLAYIFAKKCVILSAEDAKKANSHFFVGCASFFMGHREEAEEQYKLALKANSNNSTAHCCYGVFLKQQGRMEEAEEQYKLALKLNPNEQTARLNYGNLLNAMGRSEEAEEQYKLDLEANSNRAATHYNYGLFLHERGRNEEAEEQYILALEADLSDPISDPIIHCCYGLVLNEMGRKGEAEKQYKIAIKLDPKYPNSHGAYGLLLLSMNLEEEAIEETKIASRLCRENGDHITEHLSLAWFYEKFASKYYNLGDYQKSGEYAEISGTEYIEAGKYAGDNFKGTSLTKGYTLKGRAKIRTLEIKTPFYKDIFKRIWNKESYEIERFTKIIDCIMDASRFYEKAAKASPKDNRLCNACSLSMSCLSEMLDYMLAVIKQKKTPQLVDKLKNWNEKLAIAKTAYKKNSKGELFIESLHKLMDCIQNLNKYKKHGTREYGRAFEECRNELSEIANNIEGPLQKIIEDSAKQMDICRLKIIHYAGTETGYVPQPSKLYQFLKWVSDPKRITAGVAGIILTVVVDHYNEYLFSLIKRFVAMLISKI